MNASLTDALQGGAVPSTPGLVRRARRLLFPPGGRALSRQNRVLTGMGEGGEILVSGGCNGVTSGCFAKALGVQGAGADDDAILVGPAGVPGRDGGLLGRFQHEAVQTADLPNRDGVFGAVVGESGSGGPALPGSSARSRSAGSSGAHGDVAGGAGPGVPSRGPARARGS